MANQTSAAVLRINGKKVGELTECSVAVKSNGQLLPTADDIIKSRGKPTAEVTFGRVRPVNGVSIPVMALLLNQTISAVTMQYGGETIEVTGTFDASTIKTMINSGQTDENGTFSGAVRVLNLV